MPVTRTFRDLRKLPRRSRTNESIVSGIIDPRGNENVSGEHAERKGRENVSDKHEREVVIHMVICNSAFNCECLVMNA
jgi:hypothetical protein